MAVRRVIDNNVARIESQSEVETYIERVKYALENGARLEFQEERLVDKNRNKKYTNKFTVSDLFPDEKPTDILREELKKLNVSEYMRTVKDLRFPKRSEMREFGRVYDGHGDVYIKFRVELIGMYGNTTTFVMSFHYAERPFSDDMFPYKWGCFEC